jgi:hypothetical protein
MAHVHGAAAQGVGGNPPNPDNQARPKDGDEPLGIGQAGRNLRPRWSAI